MRGENRGLEREGTCAICGLNDTLVGRRLQPIQTVPGPRQRDSRRSPVTTYPQAMLFRAASESPRTGSWSPRFRFGSGLPSAHRPTQDAADKCWPTLPSRRRKSADGWRSMPEIPRSTGWRIQPFYFFLHRTPLYSGEMPKNATANRGRTGFYGVPMHIKAKCVVNIGRPQISADAFTKEQHELRRKKSHARRDRGV